MCFLVNARIIEAWAMLARFSGLDIHTGAWACGIPGWLSWMILARAMPPKAWVIPILIGMLSMTNFVIPEFRRMSVLVIPMVKSALMISCRYRTAFSALVENDIWRMIVCLPATLANMNLNSAFSFLLMVSRSWLLISLGGRGSATEITISLWILDVPGLNRGTSFFFFLLTTVIKSFSFPISASFASVFHFISWLICGWLLLGVGLLGCGLTVLGYSVRQLLLLFLLFLKRPTVSKKLLMILFWEAMFVAMFPIIFVTSSLFPCRWWMLAVL